MRTRTVLVTGANGFIGSAVCAALRGAGASVRAAVQRPCPPGPGTDGDEAFVAVGNIGLDTDWGPALAGVDTIIHLAARVHILHETESDPLRAYRRVNAFGTERLARQAASAGVRRMVFLSSVGVHGNRTDRHPFSECDPANPHDAYALSKWEAEKALRHVAGETGLGVVVLRPPLVYGPGVRGNFLSLLGLVNRGIPLPLGAVRNRRSLLSLGNLVDGIRLCLTHPVAPGKTFLLCDGEDLSTADLVRRLAVVLGRRTALFPVPASLLKLGAGCVGRAAEARRLLGSLSVDDRLIRQELEWTPPFTVDDGLAETAAWFRATRS